MKNSEKLKSIAVALDLEKQFENAEIFINKIYGKVDALGFPGLSQDLSLELAIRKRDFPDKHSAFIVVSLNEPKLKKQPKEKVIAPEKQEKHYSLKGKNKNKDFYTYFYSEKYLSDIAKENGYEKIKVFPFGKSMLNIAVLFFKPVPVPLSPKQLKRLKEEQALTKKNQLAA